MDEIPEDVMNAADAVIERYNEGLVEAIARAILAERKRCAEVARNYGTAPGLPDGKSGAFRKHRHAIANAIESGQ
jgi:hypothetical protein